MGKVRPDHVKKLARKLLEKLPNRFNSNFENNKTIVENFTNVNSRKIRNRVAGYITHLVKISSNQDYDY